MLERVTIKQWYVRAGTWISALFVLLHLAFGLPAWMSVPFSILWMASVLHVVARIASPSKRYISRVLFGGLASLGGAGLLLLGLYFAFNLSTEVLYVFVLIATASAWSLARTEALHIPRLPPRDWRIALLVLTVAGEFFMLATFAWNRTDAARTSPWVFYGIAFFLLYGCTTFFLLWYARESKGPWSLALSALHFFVSFSVVSVIYAVGFGFDPFIHRAAETALAADGFIEPKHILYSGQYVLVAALHRMTGISISLVDVWLVPLLGAVLLPLAAHVGLTRGANLSDPDARVWLHFLLVIPFLSLVFTVPYNITVVLTLTLAFLLLALPNVSSPRLSVVLALTSAFSLFVHPLLSAPACVLVGYMLWQRWGTFRFPRAAATIFFLAVVTVTPALFSLYNAAQGVSPFVLENPLARSDFFIGLFTDPYRHDYFPIPRLWEVLYLYRTYVPPAIFFASLVLSVTALRQHRAIQTIGLFNAGLLVSLFFTSTMFVFKDIIFYEQSEFSLRVLHGGYLLATIPIMVYLAEVTKPARERFFPMLTILAIVSAMSAFSFYFSYPQSNPKSVMVGPSVSGADVEAVAWIDERANGEPYIVLSNQMTSAAALQELGFAHYHQTPFGEVLWYAIPTGGELYKYFWAMTFEQPRRETMWYAAQFTNTRRGYFLVYNYWPTAGWLAAQAQQTADNSYEIRGGEVIIFEYLFP